MALKRIWRRPARVFYGWWVVAVGCVVSALSGGLHFFGSTVFFLPLSRDLGMSRAVTSLVFSLSSVEGSAAAPLAGWSIDRLGPRWIIMGGAILAGVGYLLLSQAHSFTSFILVYLGLVSLGTSAGFSRPILAAVNSFFVRRRGLAMAITLSAFSAGGALGAPLLSYLVHQLGWRPTVAIGGLIILVTVIPLSLIVRRSPESMGLRPDGDSAERVAAPPPRHAVVSGVDFTVKQALRTPSYWMLAVASSLRLGAFVTLWIHFIPIMVWKGVDEEQAAFVLGVLLFWAMPMRIGLGWLGDHWSRPRVVSFTLGMGILALLILLYGKLAWHLWLFVALAGVMEGTSPINWAIIGDFFGRRYYATIHGVTGLFTGMATAGVPIIAGAIYDRTQSYQFVLPILIALLALASLLFALMRPPRRPEST